MTEDWVGRLADLAVRFGANVQEGQVVAVSTEPGKEPLARAVADAAYRAGAKFVDVATYDAYVKRARLLHGSEDAIGFVPSWLGERVLELGRQHGASVGLTGAVAPDLLEDVDPERVGKDTWPALEEWAVVVSERSVNWTAVPCPTPDWAALVYPDLGRDEGLERLWEEVARCCRLDEPDPVAAWTERQDELERIAGELDSRRFDRLHYEGPGTDLTIGLLPSSRWITARFTTAWGLRHMPNIPSEETFTTPDPERVDGVVRSTKPLVRSGTVIRDLEVEFRGGRAVRIEASTGGEGLDAMTAVDDGAARLGEVALVDNDSRVGKSGMVFYDTLLDENASSHIALGRGFPFTVGDDDMERVNHSKVHVDFMVGSDDLVVTGITSSGERVPVLAGGRFQL
ncbi:MAG TPA: aminopeptidase [Thermoleophilaceae bacterium]